MRLDHTDPSPPLDDQATPVSSGGFGLGVIAGLFVGLLAGFAGGFLIGRQGETLPAPRSAAQAVAPTAALQSQTYTDAPVADEIQEHDVPAQKSGQPARPSVAADDPRHDPTDTSGRGSTTTPRAPSAIPRQPSAIPRAPSTLRPGPLRSADPGVLQVVSLPSGAQVFVDDARVGTTPVTVSGVSPGPHRVRLELPGHRRWTTSVDVASGAHMRVGASLER